MSDPIAIDTSLLSVPDWPLDWLRRKVPPVYAEPQLTVIILSEVGARHPGAQCQRTGA